MSQFDPPVSFCKAALGRCVCATWLRAQSAQTILRLAHLLKTINSNYLTLQLPSGGWPKTEKGKLGNKWPAGRFAKLQRSPGNLGGCMHVQALITPWPLPRAHLEAQHRRRRLRKSCHLPAWMEEGSPNTDEPSATAGRHWFKDISDSPSSR